MLLYSGFHAYRFDGGRCLLWSKGQRVRTAMVVSFYLFFLLPLSCLVLYYGVRSVGPVSFCCVLLCLVAGHDHHEVASRVHAAPCLRNHSCPLPVVDTSTTEILRHLRWFPLCCILPVWWVSCSIPVAQLLACLSALLYDGMKTPLISRNGSIGYTLFVLSAQSRDRIVNL